MTLNVNLEDVPWAILEAVRGRIMSNRRRLEESQQEQQRPALQPKPQFRKFGADGRTWKRPEPAAVLDLKKQTVIGAYQRNIDRTIVAGSYAGFQYSYLSSIPETGVLATYAVTGGRSDYTKTTSAKTRLFSASGQSSVTIDLPLAPYPAPTDYNPRIEFLGSGVGAGFAGDWKYYRYRYIIENVITGAELENLGFLCLPIEADKFIVVMLYSHVAVTSTKDIHCFPEQIYQSYYGESLEGWPGQIDVVENALVRYAEDFTSMDYGLIFPNLSFTGTSFTTTQTTFYSTGKLHRAFVFSNNSIREITVKGPLLDLVTSPNYFGEPSIGSPDTKDLQAVKGRTITPNIFAQLNQRISFVNQEQIKQFPANKKPVLSDVRAGFFSTISSGSPAYGQEPLWAEYSGNISNVPPPDHGDSNLYLAYRNLNRAGVAFPVDGLNQSSLNFNWVWDWDDPAYCRRMCLALGFTAADLKP